jgi:hypothetical protein
MIRHPPLRYLAFSLAANGQVAATNALPVLLHRPVRAHVQANMAFKYITTTQTGSTSTAAGT